jgi:protein N-terminal amidase
MDLNPQIDNWMLSHAPYELASHCISNKANVLILLNAWLDSEKSQDEAHDWSTLNYWAARLQPLWANDEENRSDDHDSESGEPPTLSANGVDESKLKGKETIVVISNRSGEENGKFFEIHSNSFP